MVKRAELGRANFIGGEQKVSEEVLVPPNIFSKSEEIAILLCKDDDKNYVPRKN